MTAESLPNNFPVSKNASEEALLDDRTRYLVQWVYLFYVTNKRKPKLEEIYNENKDRFGSILEVATCIDSRGFKRCINLRGVMWVNERNLTSEQMYVISYITDPTQTGSLKARLSKVGVSYAKWRGWLANGTFRTAFNSVASQLLEENFQEVDRGLLMAAGRGDVSAIKFAYELTGRYDPARKQALDVASVLARVVEIISTHVKDPETLQRIGGDLTMLSAGQGIRTDLIVGEPVYAPVAGPAQNGDFKILEGETVFGNFNE